MQMINIGFGNFVNSHKLIAVVSPDSAPIKRVVNQAKENGMLIDASYGRKTKSVVIMDSDHVILSALKPATIGQRFSDEDITEEEQE